MARFIVLFFACLALAAARQVRRDAPPPSPLQEIEKHATEFSKTFTEQINSLANSKNTQEFNKALKDGSDSVLKQLSAFSSSLQNAVNDASGKAKEALEQSRANIQKAAEDLRKAHPEVEQHATQLRERIESTVKSVVAESQKLAKEVAANMEQTNQKLAPQIKSAYDDFVKQAEEVQKKLHEVATKQ
ncbi:apolipophorin-3-like [Maniola jurtina]|uniref:apolipophorin-3-like n=1 Tax=Maniola jurtina TaxID=191418 RepID=UPI001E686D0B|nr:apolipophorin-3-like [Maniola jurtina]